MSKDRHGAEDHSRGGSSSSAEPRIVGDRVLRHVPLHERDLAEDEKAEEAGR
jgi:hypothetical protein